MQKTPCYIQKFPFRTAKRDTNTKIKQFITSWALRSGSPFFRFGTDFVPEGERGEGWGVGITEGVEEQEGDKGKWWTGNGSAVDIVNTKIQISTLYLHNITSFDKISQSISDNTIISKSCHGGWMKPNPKLKFWWVLVSRTGTGRCVDLLQQLQFRLS